MSLPSITWADVVVIAPQLAGTELALQDAILAQVDAELVNPALLPVATYAKALLGAALATQRTRFSTEAVGPALDDTSYGRELRRLLENTPGLRFLGVSVGC